MTADTQVTKMQGARHRLARWLTVDAVVTGANAVGYLVLAGWLAGHLGPEAGLLRAVGVFLLAFTLLVVAARATRSPALVAVVVAVNAAWAVASVVVAAVGAFDLTDLGRVWSLLQAVVVGALGALQLRALRDGRVR